MGEVEACGGLLLWRLLLLRRAVAVVRARHIPAPSPGTSRSATQTQKRLKINTKHAHDRWPIGQRCMEVHREGAGGKGEQGEGDSRFVSGNEAEGDGDLAAAVVHGAQRGLVEGVLLLPLLPLPPRRALLDTHRPPGRKLPACTPSR